MNQNIDRLYQIAKKDTRIILGLMSGTSLDGLDFALCQIGGSAPNINLSILAFETLTYSSAFRDEIKSVFAQKQVNLEMLCAMNAKIAQAHADLIRRTLKIWKVPLEAVDLIASHGQTVFHAPRSGNRNAEYPNSTLQIGDGDHIAVLTGIITISDFRQKHVAAGGEGAPLVVYGDYMLFSSLEENRVMLNIGGIANFTFLPAGKTTAALVSTDVGPGNTLMNQYMLEHFQEPFDKDGKVAAAGKINVPLLKALVKHPFFNQILPKTTGPEIFNLDFVYQAQQESKTEKISHEDIMATLCGLTVAGIAGAVKDIAKGYPHLNVYVSGGGLNNPTLMNTLKKELIGVSIESIAVLGMPPDAKEAALFALLANETVSGSPVRFPEETGAPAVCMGKISFPI